MLAFEAGCQDYCKGEIKEIEWQGGQVYLCRAPRHDDPPPRSKRPSSATRAAGQGPGPGLTCPRALLMRRRTRCYVDARTRQ